MKSLLLAALAIFAFSPSLSAIRLEAFSRDFFFRKNNLLFLSSRLVFSVLVVFFLPKIDVVLVVVVSIPFDYYAPNCERTFVLSTAI